MLKVKQLQEAWSDFFKSNECQHLRFGQYVFNHYGFEVENSYNIENNDEAYQLIFNKITMSFDELVERDKKRDIMKELNESMSEVRKIHGLTSDTWTIESIDKAKKIKDLIEQKIDVNENLKKALDEYLSMDNKELKDFNLFDDEK